VRTINFLSALKLTHEPLYKQTALIIAIIPMLIATVIICFSDYGNLNLFSHEAQANFIREAKLPLFIIAASPIILSFIINAHRSVQTRHQINNVEEKNKIDMYLAHHKYHIELFKSRDRLLRFTEDATIKIKIDNVYHFYSVVFPKNNFEDGVVSITPKAKDSALRELTEAIYFQSFTKEPCEKIRDEIKKEVGREVRSQSDVRSYIDFFNQFDYSNNGRILPICINNILHPVFHFMGSYDIILASDSNTNINSSLTNRMHVSEKKLIIKEFLLFWLNLNKAVNSNYDIREEAHHIAAFFDFLEVVENKVKY